MGDIHGGLIRRSSLRIGASLVAGIGIALCLAGPVTAETRQFDEPFAMAFASDTPPGGHIPNNDWQMDADFTLGALDQARYVIAGSGGASAQAAASVFELDGRLRFGLVTSRAQGPATIAGAQTMVLVDVGDPLHRDRVKLDFDVSAAVSVQGEGRGSWSWRVDGATGEPGQLILVDGKITFIDLPDGASHRSHPWPLLGSFSSVRQGTVEIETYLYGNIAASATLPQSSTKTKDHVTIAVPPGPLVVQITTSATANAIAVADPVVLPNAENPEVTVHIESGVDATSRSPLFGLTVEDLAAAGFDAAPFIDTGFVDAPSTTTTTAPATTTSSTTTSTTTTSTTLTSATTTSTTVPEPAACPDDDAGHLACRCDADFTEAACEGSTIPATIARPMDQACRSVTRGLAVGPERHGARALRHAAQLFGRARRRVEHANANEALSAECRSAISVDAADAEVRVRRLVGA